MTTQTLIPVLGDQLSLDLASLVASDPATSRVLMVEAEEEATYVRHHKKKIAFVFSAMRHFAEELRGLGWQVDYVRLDDPGNTGSFTGEVKRAATRLKPDAIRVTEPGEWRVLEAMRRWERETGVPVEMLEDDRFLCPHGQFAEWADGRKQLRMEYFYREMRRETGLLMEDGEPAGGQWNYDHDNRKPAGRDLSMPKPFRVEPDEITKDVLALVETRFGDHFGALEPFGFPVTRQDAVRALDGFIETSLARFGDFQDAMLVGEPLLYHSLLSPCLNVGLLSPLEVCRRVEQAWKAGGVPINAAEGFIRQIIGWREYVRGIYWRFMPDYVTRNALGADKSLPDFYWTGETDMACLRAAITQTRDEAYAHHIQRLMVTGNFAMLAGVDPHAVHAWYLAVYADAFEWVELPNTLGMSQFADGGLLGSKPYAASGNYINKMSDYCAGCRYDVKEKTGEGACPFNPLYWNFLVRNEDRLRGNPRMRQMYSTWDRMAGDRKDGYRQAAAAVLDALESGRRI